MMAGHLLPGCHPPLDRIELEKVMSGYLSQQGWYLVRASVSLPGEYVISACFRGEVKNIKINRSPDGQYFVGSRLFQTIPGLIQAYRDQPIRNAEGQAFYLKFPIPVATAGPPTSQRGGPRVAPGPAGRAPPAVAEAAGPAARKPPRQVPVRSGPREAPAGNPPPGRGEVPPTSAGSGGSGGGDDSERLCMLCMDAPRDATFVHNATGHLACCMACAKEVKQRSNACPICRQPIDAVIQQFIP